MIYLGILIALAAIVAYRSAPIPSSEIQGCDIVRVLKREGGR